MPRIINLPVTTIIGKNEQMLESIKGGKKTESYEPRNIYFCFLRSTLRLKSIYLPHLYHIFITNISIFNYKKNLISIHIHTYGRLILNKFLLSNTNIHSFFFSLHFDSHDPLALAARSFYANATGSLELSTAEERDEKKSVTGSMKGEREREEGSV